MNKSARNCTRNPHETAAFFTFTEEIRNGKLHFLYSILTVRPSMYNDSIHIYNSRLFCNKCQSFNLLFYFNTSLKLEHLQRKQVGQWKEKVIDHLCWEKNRFSIIYFLSDKNVKLGILPTVEFQNRWWSKGHTIWSFLQISVSVESFKEKQDFLGMIVTFDELSTTPWFLCFIFWQEIFQ